MKRLLLISGGVLPIPSVKGGAVETLIDSIIKENERCGVFRIDVISCRGTAIPENQKLTNYILISYPLLVQMADRLAWFYSEKIKKDWKSMFIRNRNKSIYYTKKMAEILDFSGYDAVVVENNMSLLAAIYEKMGERYQHCCYYHMHSVLVDNKNMIPYLASCKKILTVSDYVTGELKHTVPELKKTEIVKIQNGIDFPKYKKDEAEQIRKKLRRKLNITDECCVFLYAGRLSPEKGAKELLEAYCSMGKSNSVLVFAGSAVSGSAERTTYSNSLRKASDTAKNRVIFTGYVEHKDMPGYYLMADVLVVPSVVGDAAPLTILEGMACGLPIISARVGGIPEYTHGYSEVFWAESGETFVDNLRKQMTLFLEKRPYERGEAILYDEESFFEAFSGAIL